MARYKVKIQTTTEAVTYIEADTLEIAVYKAENENVFDYINQPEVVSKKATGISLIEETVTEQELPSSDWIGYNNLAPFVFLTTPF